jgi:uncharacterized membrane protein
VIDPPLRGESVFPPSPSPASDVADATLFYVAYVFLGLGLVLPLVLPLVAVIIAYLKRGESGALLRAHADWIIVTFWVSLAVGIVGSLLTLLLIGWAVLLVLWIWFLYRIVRGVVRLSEGRAPGA